MTKKKGKHCPTKEKAKKILHDGSIRGKKLTLKQKKFFGAIAGGSHCRRGKKKR